jgi:hypothetical protein
MFNTNASYYNSSKILFDCAGCTEWESLLVQAHMLELTPNRFYQVKKCFKWKTVFRNDMHSYDAEGKVCIEAKLTRRANKARVPPPTPANIK